MEDIRIELYKKLLSSRIESCYNYIHVKPRDIIEALYFCDFTREEIEWVLINEECWSKEETERELNNYFTELE